MKEMENMNEAKLKLWARIDEMKAQQAASKKREEEEEHWNAPLDIKDRDWLGTYPALYIGRYYESWNYKPLP